MIFFKDLITQIKRIFSAPSFWALTGFIFLLIISWFYLNQSFFDSEEEQTHSFLQSRFQNLVSDYVDKKYPEITEIIFHKVWTKKTTHPEEIEIFFSYSLLTKGQAGGDLLIDGKALLIQVSTNFWKVQNFQVTESAVDFSEPMLIKAEKL